MIFSVYCIKGAKQMKYEELLVEADYNNLIIKEKPLRANKGRIKGKKIAIKKELSDIEKGCVLAEELGHFYTCTNDILDQNDINNRKQEHYGRVWSYNKLVGLYGIIDCYKAHCKNRYEMANHLEVTEEFLNEALNYYKNKYGIYTTIDNYIINFEPYIFVLEKFK